MSSPYPDGLPPHINAGTPGGAVATSLAAAESMAECAETLRLEVLAYIRKQGAEGATDYELEHRLNMRGSTVRPRRRELVLDGLIEDTGLTRTTDSGRQAAVWVTVPPERRAEVRASAQEQAIAEQDHRQLLAEAAGLAPAVLRSLLAARVQRCHAPGCQAPRTGLLACNEHWDGLSEELRRQYSGAYAQMQRSTSTCIAWWGRVEVLP
jgi:hypothetical protein